MRVTWIGAIRKREISFLLNHENWVNESKHRPRLRFLKSNYPTKDATQSQNHVTSLGLETARQGKLWLKEKKKKLTYAWFQVRWGTEVIWFSPYWNRMGQRIRGPSGKIPSGALKYVESSTIFSLYF